MWYPALFLFVKVYKYNPQTLRELKIAAISVNKLHF
jgi:hypothetical protein